MNQPILPAEHETPITDASILTGFPASFPIVHADVCKAIERQLAEAIEQRDRLAEALRMIVTHNEGDGQCDNGHTPRWLALNALATLDRKADELENTKPQ